MLRAGGARTGLRNQMLRRLPQTAAPRIEVEQRRTIPKTQRYNYNHVTFNNIQDPPPHSGLNVRNQRIKKCTKGSNMIRRKKECISPAKNIANVSSLPPYEECASPSTKERKEKQNSDTEKPLQSANETHHELITDHVWCSCNR